MSRSTEPRRVDTRADSAVPVQRAAREQHADRLADAALKAAPDAGHAVAEHAPGGLPSSPLHTALGGAALPGPVRADMEHRFGVGFGGVSISADARSDVVARGLRARAFAHRGHVGFAAGEFAPATESGRHLLAHELAHVVQQRSSASPDMFMQPAAGGGLDAQSDDLRAALGSAADEAARKPLVARAAELGDRLIAALKAAKTATPPDGGEPGEAARANLVKLGRALAGSGEVEAAVQLALRADDPVVTTAVVHTLRGSGQGVAGQQRSLSRVARMGGHKLSAGDTQHSQQWLKTNTPAIGKALSKVDQLGATGLKRESAALELSEQVLKEYYVHSSANEKPDPLGDPTGASLRVDSTTQQIQADCDVYATYGARLTREQGWETVGFLALIPDEPDPAAPAKQRDGHAVALARKAVDPKDPTRGWMYLGIGNEEIRELVGHGLALSTDANAMPFLISLAFDAYQTPLPRKYDLYYMAAGPGGSYNPKLLDPKNNGLKPFQSSGTGGSTGSPAARPTGAAP